jgi:glutamate formiminotransferase/formiminotetrahydrofolate cyclodeaminase
MDAFGMPKKTDEEKAERTKAIQEASKYAMEVPYQVMETAYQSFELLKAMAETGNPNSVSDAGVGALATLTAVEGAFLNVKINAQGIDDKDFTNKLTGKAEEILEKSRRAKEEIAGIVERKIENL